MSKHAMATHHSKISEKNISRLAEIPSLHKKTLRHFYEVWADCLKDVRHDYGKLKPDSTPWKDVWEDVRVTACEVIVDKTEDGGMADDGLARGTFDGYVCKIKRVFRFKVPLEIAEKATDDKLKKVRNHVIGVHGNKEPTEKQMVDGYKWLKDEQVKQKQTLRRIAYLIDYFESHKTNNEELTDELKKAAVSEMPNELGTATNEDFGKAWVQATTEPTTKTGNGNKTPYTLPNWNDYETGDTKVVLVGGIDGMLAWLTAKLGEPHLQKHSEEAKVLRSIRSDLQAYKERQKKDVPVDAKPVREAV